MIEATLINHIVAWESENEDATKHFPVGTIIYVDDHDDDWFSFEDASGVYYECDERPDKSYLHSSAKVQDNVQSQASKAYVPVPNMTPLERKFLLL